MRNRITRAIYVETNMNISQNIRDNLPSIQKTTDIASAAEMFREKARELGNFKIAATANIASKDPMVDGEGNILASHIFAWSDNENSWWKRPELALSSPIPKACRYESEAFWVNADGFNTRAPNVLLNDIDLSKFSDHVRPKALICVPHDFSLIM